MICVYFVSYVPTLLMLRIPGHERQNAKLMFLGGLIMSAIKRDRGAKDYGSEFEWIAAGNVSKLDAENRR